MRKSRTHGSVRVSEVTVCIDTDIEDLEIDYIEVELVTGKTVTVDWDESDITREDDGFEARYKGGF